MLSPYSEAQLLGRFCNFLMKSPNFGTPYCTVYTRKTAHKIYIHYSIKKCLIKNLPVIISRETFGCDCRYLDRQPKDMYSVSIHTGIFWDMPWNLDRYISCIYVAKPIDMYLVYGKSRYASSFIKIYIRIHHTRYIAAWIP